MTETPEPKKTDPMKILVISGSLRKESFNTRLARALAELAPEGMDIEVATLHGIPLYDGDAEQAQGVPPAVVELRDRIKACDGIILVTPEYNAGMPGVFKNAIDWLTRPPSEIKPTFGDKPTALAGATPGGGGTILSQAGWLVVLRQIGVRLIPGHLRLASASNKLPADSELPSATREQLEKWLANLRGTLR